MLGRSIMPRDAARFLGDEAESYDEQSGAERDGSTERHNRSLNQRTRMRKQFLVVAMLLMISAAVLLAHDLFLKLDNYFVPPNTAVRLAVLNGTFSKSEGPAPPARLLHLSMFEPAARRPIAGESGKRPGDTTCLSG